MSVGRVDFTIKAGEQLPLLSLRLLNPNKQPFDLTGFTGVFRMADQDMETVQDGSITINADPTTGIATYEFDGDQVVGLYYGQVVLTRVSDSAEQTFPQNGTWVIEVQPKLSPA